MRRSVQDLTRFFVFASVFVSARTFANSPAEKAAEDFFESEIRPLLLERCVKCHGAKKQESDLRLDSRSSILRGGASGPTVAIDRAAGSSASDLDTSLLLRVVRREGEIKMPPRKALVALQGALPWWGILVCAAPVALATGTYFPALFELAARNPLTVFALDAIGAGVGTLLATFIPIVWGFQAYFLVAGVLFFLTAIASHRFFRGIATAESGE